MVYVPYGTRRVYLLLSYLMGYDSTISPSCTSHPLQVDILPVLRLDILPVLLQEVLTLRTNSKTSVLEWQLI